MKNVSLVVALGLVTLTTGCASIVNGQNQSLSVSAKSKGKQVDGANCKLSNDKGTWFVNAPGSATVHRSYEDLAVKCEKEGYAPGTVAAKSSTKAMAFGNIIFGGVIGGGVDIATGAAYDYPSLIDVEMGQSSVLAPPAPATTEQVSSASIDSKIKN